MNALEGGRESIVGQPDGRNHVEREEVVAGVRGWVGGWAGNIRERGFKGPG